MLGTLRGSVLAASRPKGIKGDLVGPTVIATSTASTATVYSPQRKIDRTQNNVLWVLYWDGTSGVGTPMRTRYSTDNGTTWVDPGDSSAFGFSGTGTIYTPHASFFIDLDDFAHTVYKDRHDGFMYYRRGTPNAARTAWTWSASQAFAAISDVNYPDLVAFRTPGASPTTWDVAIVASNGPADRALYERLRVANNGSVTINNLDGLEAVSGMGALSGIYGNTNHKLPSIDFNHTGDGKTVAGGTPHLYVGWSAGAIGAGKGIRFRKATYSAGAWTWGTEREIDNGRYVFTSAPFWLNCMFDGTRVVMPGLLADTGDDLVLYERDSADTTTTTRVLIDNLAEADCLFGGSSSYDSNGNIYMVGRDHFNAQGNGTRLLNWRKWTRSSNTLGAKVAIDSTTPNEPYVSAKRGYSNSRIEFVYTDNTASPFNVTFGGIK